MNKKESSNFDYLKDLYISDPEEFKKVTDAMITATIDALPLGRQQKTRAKQWRLTQELSKYKDPIARLNRFVVLFWEGVSEFDHAIKQYQRKVLSNDSIQTEDIKSEKDNIVNLFTKK